MERASRAWRAGRRGELHRRDFAMEGRWRGRRRRSEGKAENHGDCRSSRFALSVSTHAANHHEVRLVQLCFDFYMIEAKPKTSSEIAHMTAIRSMKNYARRHRNDRAHRSNRSKPATQDGRRLRRYARRWLVGSVSPHGFNGSADPRRWEYYPELPRLRQLACLVILFKGLASNRSNHASAPIRLGMTSSGRFPNRTPKAKLSASNVSCGNHLSGTLGARVNHLRPLGPWQTNIAGA